MMDPVAAYRERTRRHARLAIATGILAVALGVGVALLSDLNEHPATAKSGMRRRPADVALSPKPVTLLQPEDESLSPTSALAKKLGGERVLNVLEAPDHGRAYLVRDAANGKRPDFEVIAGPIPISGDTLARLSASLSDPANYNLHLAAGCGVTWHVWYQLEKGADVVDVLSDFRCSQLRATLVGGAPLGGGIGFAHFFQSQATFAGLARELFPDDVSLREW